MSTFPGKSKIKKKENQTKFNVIFNLAQHYIDEEDRSKSECGEVHMNGGAGGGLMKEEETIKFLKPRSAVDT